jgi:coenzyme PQQ precursor peptide PqqA
MQPVDTSPELVAPAEAPETKPAWTTPTFEEVRMDAEISSYVYVLS